MAIRPADIPPAVAFVSIDPQFPSAAKTLEESLEKASREDPSLRWNKDENSDQYILSGMGKLHLEVAKHHLKTNYKVDALWGGIEVDYKECILGQTAPHYHMYERNVLGKDGKAGCTATIKPLAEDHKEHLTEACYKRDGNVIHISIPPPDEPRTGLPFDPETIRPPLLNGVIAGLASGPRRGSPLHNCHVTLEFKSERDWFNTTTGAHLFGAAYRAVKDCLKEANNSKMVGMLEPMMRVHINCPADVAGTVQHDLTSAAGGTILEINDDNAERATSTTVDVSEIYAPPDPYDSVRGLKERPAHTHMLEIVAKVPLKSMLDYDDHIRSRTAGRHTILMSLDTFERVIGHREKELDL